jgi:MFS family permease
MTGKGYDPVTAGSVMFLSATALCLVTGVVAAIGLKAGTPLAPLVRPPLGRLLTSGVRNLRNPRIALAYAGAFAARSDVVIKGLFLALWAIQSGRDFDLRPAQAMARFGTMIAVMYAVSLISAPAFGWFIDRVNRMTAMIVALVFGATGYLSMYVITSPLDFAMLPYLIVLTLGAGFTTKASMALIGQEAPVAERGSVIAMTQTFGAIGILFFTVVGGRLFDEWGPWAPFVIAGAYQAALLVAAVVIRVVSPGLSLHPGSTRRRQIHAARTAS